MKKTGLRKKKPIRVDHVHIVDSIVEIRFVPKTPKTAFIDLLATVSKFLDDYDYRPSEIPAQVRKGEPQFEFAVEGTLVGTEYSIGVGPKSLVFNCQNGYKTWSEFFPYISKVLDAVAASNSIERVTRVGVRFSNFFESLNDLSLFVVNWDAGMGITKPTDQIVVKFSSSFEGIGYNVTIANLLTIPAKGPGNGTLIDVDAFNDKLKTSTINDELYKEIDLIHESEKDMFFSLLSDELLDSLNPIYP